MSYYKVVGGQRYDKALLDAFKKSVEGQGDGRVSAKDVETELKSRVADGKGLTEVEAETLRFAAEQFNITGKGQRELGALLEQLTGKPFEFQRAGGVVQGQLDGQALSHKQLAQKATAFVLANATTGASVPDDKIFPGVDASNMGLFAYTLDGAQAKQLVDLSKTMVGAANRKILDKYDPAKHEVLTVRFTSDEEQMYIGLVDKKTGDVEMAGSWGFVDIGYSFDDAAEFESKTGIKLKDIDANHDPEYWEEIDEEEFAALLTRGGTLLDLGKSDDVFGRPSDKRIEELGYPLSSDWRDGNIMDGEVDLEFGQVPLGFDPAKAALMVAGDVFQYADMTWDTPLKAKPARAVTDAAIKSAAQAIHDGFGYSPQNSESFDENHTGLQKLIDKLGKPADIKLIEIKGAGRPEHLDTDTPLDVGGFFFLNEKTGDFVAVTTRDSTL